MLSHTDQNDSAKIEKSIRIVLCRPNSDSNISASKRVSDAFGFPLSVVSERLPGSIDGVPQFERLEQALSRAAVTAGITRRLGQRRKSQSLSLDRFSACVGLWSALITNEATNGRRGEIVLLFGNETSGLSDEELTLCNIAVSIPTDPACPSLNLSHAVALVAYRLSMEFETMSPDVSPSVATSSGSTDQLRLPSTRRETGVTVARRSPRDSASPRHASEDKSTAHLTASVLLRAISNAGYLLQDGPQGMRRFVRDIIARLLLDPTESALLIDHFRTVPSGRISGQVSNRADSKRQ